VDDVGLASVGDGDEWPGEWPVDPDPFPAFPPDDGGVVGDPTDPWGGDDGWVTGGGWDDTDGVVSMCPGWSGWTGSGGRTGRGWGGNGWDGGWTGSGGGWTGGGVPGEWLDQIPPPGVPGDSGGQSDWDLLAARLVELIDAILEGLGRRDDDPEPIGDSPQIDNVQLVRNSQDARLFQVLWDVAGDESQIDHFEVSLWHLAPERSQPLIADVTPDGQSQVATGFHASQWIRPTRVPLHWHAYIQPMVVAVLKDGSDNSGWPTEVGAALPYVLADTTAMKQPRPQRVDDEVLIQRGTAAGDAPAWIESIVQIGDLSLESDQLTSNVVTKVPLGDNTIRTIRYVVTPPFEPGTWGEFYSLSGHVSVLQPPPDGRPVRLEISPAGDPGGVSTPSLDLLAADRPQLIQIFHTVESREEEQTPRMEFELTFRAGTQHPGQTPRGAPGGDGPEPGADQTGDYCLVAICGLRWARRVSGGQ
jgi:hypothetical protein